MPKIPAINPLLQAWLLEGPLSAQVPAYVERLRCGSTRCHPLTELARTGPLPLSELGTRVSLEKSWVSRAVEAMVERGLVTKEPNPLDARIWLVTLTDEGVRTINELNQTLDAHAEQLLGSLNTRERAAVENSLLLLMKALREDTAANCCLPPPERKDAKSCC